MLNSSGSEGVVAAWPEDDAAIWLEAESADLSAPMQVLSDPGATGGSCISVPQEYGFNGGQGAPGALLFLSTTPGGYGLQKTHLISAGGSGVRVSGIRIEGPDTAPDSPWRWCRVGIYSEYPGLEVDNSEISGWSYAAVLLQNTADSGSAGDPMRKSAYIHHNHIHHNQQNGLGYGIDVGGGSEALIEANLFDSNRHCIASEGYAKDGYEARYNIITENSPAWWSHNFDMHADPDTSGSERPAGNIVLIHHNTFMGAFRDDPQNSYCIGIQGIPRSGAEIDHNWFYASASQRDSPEAVYTENNPTTRGITVVKNIIGKDRVLQAESTIFVG
jgi:hypothetical protein